MAYRHPASGWANAPRVTPRRIEIPQHIKQLRVERSNAPDHGWCLWINANGDFTIGTYIRLGDDGRITKVHLHPDGTETELEL